MLDQAADSNTRTRAFVPSNQGEMPQDLLTHNKNGTTSPLCKVGEETSPCATQSIDNTLNENTTPLQDRNEGTVEGIKKDPEGSEMASETVPSAVQEFSTYPSTLDGAYNEKEILKALIQEIEKIINDDPTAKLYKLETARIVDIKDRVIYEKELPYWHSLSIVSNCPICVIPPLSHRKNAT